MDRTDRSVFVVFGSISVRFGPSSFLSRSGPTPSPKLSVLHIGPNRTETEPMLSIPDFSKYHRYHSNLALQNYPPHTHKSSWHYTKVASFIFSTNIYN